MIFFDPWVGSQYESGGIFGKKIMVLGESHYCGEDCADCGVGRGCESFTTKVMRDYLDQNNEREGWMSTFLKFERSLVNRWTSPEESVIIWNSVLFYNFLQVAMHGPRRAGTPAQYQAAAAPFYEVLEKYEPDLIVVWGTRLWYNMPGEGWVDGEDFRVDGYPIKNGWYRLANQKMVKVICVYHPSTGYSWDYWHRAIMQKG